MVAFAGYDMPVQFPMGVMREHLHTREHAGLFDVSHMGQVILRPHDTLAAVESALEALMPVSVAGLAPGRQRYGLLTNNAGGILDDLMFANLGDHIVMVVNAANKQADIDHLRTNLASVATVDEVTDRALLALQGPKAATILASFVPQVERMRFMDFERFDSPFGTLWISRSGYTGEDGFEISVPTATAEKLARALLEAPDVAPVGLGARDSLRLEAGLCLHGHDIDQSISPSTAGLGWAIQKVRRKAGAREGGFPGAAYILQELADGPEKIRVGLRPDGRAPMREGTVLWDNAEAGAKIGRITSGGFGPSVGAPIAMGYVPVAVSRPGTRLWGELRGKRLPVTVCELPFRPSTYKR